MTVPFNRVTLAGDELAHIAAAVASGQIAGDQQFARQCETVLQSELGVCRALLCTSCTHALEMCALLLGIEAGDEVIVPSFTFVSTANAFALRGARLAFADIRPDTLCLDADHVRRLVSRRTKAVVTVHYAGVGGGAAELAQTAAGHGIPLIEDNAHGLFGKCGGRWLGTFGDLAAQSFHATKNITCGEGGALLINRESYVERAEVIREKGTNRSRFFRGQVDKYTWVDTGSSYVVSDILAAFLYGQLSAWRDIQARRKAAWDRYHAELQSWAVTQAVRQPAVPGDCEQSYHMYYMIMPSLQDRQGLIEHLAREKIMATFHYVPLHLSPMGRRVAAAPSTCPVTEYVSDRIIRLPFYTGLSETDQTRVIEAVKGFRCASRP